MRCCMVGAGAPIHKAACRQARPLGKERQARVTYAQVPAQGLLLLGRLLNLAWEEAAVGLAPLPKSWCPETAGFSRLLRVQVPVGFLQGSVGRTGT